MEFLKKNCNLKELGLNKTNLDEIELIHKKHGNRLYRIKFRGEYSIIKWFKVGDDNEVKSYNLLNKLGVPTINLLGQTENALLLEDLDYSQDLRLATADVLNSCETGVAVARWYQKLHSAGEQFLSESEQISDFLKWQIDELDSHILYNLGQHFNIQELPGWQLAIDNIEVLRDRIKSLPVTINYNDFYWTNLALSREGLPRQAVMFDYHLMGKGSAILIVEMLHLVWGQKQKKHSWKLMDLLINGNVSWIYPYLYYTVSKMCLNEKKFPSGVKLY